MPASLPPCQMVCVSRLPADLKRRVWAHIKDTSPATAAVLADTDPDSPIAQLAKLIGGSTIWLPVADTGLTTAELGSLSTSMVSWRGAGISLPTPTASMAADTSSASALRARSSRGRR